jgi:hypothetical protein
LPETAVDLETLEVLERHKVQFTILAPWQAESEDIDPTEPYRVALPAGREITVFFYQRELSTRVSFDPASTIDADLFAKHALQRSFRPGKHAQLLVVASDGELYGHHQRLREHFLARLVDGAGSQIGLQPTFPALWLKTHPPQRTTRIRERTSWSCHHGVMRWMGPCACTPGDASWKAQLRYAFEHLAGELDHLYLEVVKPHIPDPWRLRDRYIHVMLDEMTIDELVDEMAGAVLPKEQVRRIHLMLEAQRERQRMFTSCGWFFEDFDRIEPRNVVAYAAQAVRLARLATGEDLEPCCAGDLSRVVSPRTGLRASDLFEHHLQRAQWVHSVKVGYAD